MHCTVVSVSVLRIVGFPHFQCTACMCQDRFNHVDFSAGLAIHASLFSFVAPLCVCFFFLPSSFSCYNTTIKTLGLVSVSVFSCCKVDRVLSLRRHLPNENMHTKKNYTVLGG